MNYQHEQNVTSRSWNFPFYELKPGKKKNGTKKNLTPKSLGISLEKLVAKKSLNWFQKWSDCRRIGFWSLVGDIWERRWLPLRLQARCPGHPLLFTHSRYNYCSHILIIIQKGHPLSFYTVQILFWNFHLNHALTLFLSIKVNSIVSIPGLWLGLEWCLCPSLTPNGKHLISFGNHCIGFSITPLMQCYYYHFFYHQSHHQAVPSLDALALLVWLSSVIQ